MAANCPTGDASCLCCRWLRQVSVVVSGTLDCSSCGYVGKDLADYGR